MSHEIETATDANGNEVANAAFANVPAWHGLGTVTDGLDIIETLAAQGARGGSDGAPAQPISILSVDVED